MTFTARERFIYYITSAMTMRGMRMIDDSKMRRIMSLILKNRCRNLTEDDREKAYKWVAYYKALLDEDDGP